jgi:hypothetical protein
MTTTAPQLSLVKPVFPKYSVAKVSHFRGHEGMQGTNGVLLADGKPVATFYDDACGGMWHLNQIIPKGNSVPAMVEAGKVFRAAREVFEAYVESLPEVPCSSNPAETMKLDTSCVLGEMVDEFDSNKRFARQCKTKTLFRLGPDDKIDGWRTILHKWDDACRAHMAKKYPGAIILNEML